MGTMWHLAYMYEWAAYISFNFHFNFNFNFKYIQLCQLHLIVTFICLVDANPAIQEEGVLFESIDALFGLPRKRSAGVSARDPLHGDRLFYKQEDVDHFVASQSSASVKVYIHMCTHFFLFCMHAVYVLSFMSVSQQNVFFMHFICTQGCNSFLAGHPIRSRSRFHALDETAVFGRACRHGFPKKFLNLKHGERCSA